MTRHEQPEPLALNDLFMFGKHQGKEIEDVIEDDPDYFVWLYENEVIEMSLNLISKLEDKKII